MDVRQASIYELHVRDFSMSDPKVPEKLRGAGHLKELFASFSAFFHPFSL